MDQQIHRCEQHRPFLLQHARLEGKTWVHGLGPIPKGRDQAIGREQESKAGERERPDSVARDEKLVRFERQAG